MSTKRSLQSGGRRAAAEAFEPERIKVVVFDADGVLVHGSTLYPAGLPAWQWVQRSGRRTYLLTNNSMRSRSAYARRWQRMGFPLRRSEIVTSGYLAALYLRRELAGGRIRPHIFVVGGPGIPAELKAVGVPGSWTRDPADERPAHYVLVGLDKQVNYRKLSRALRAILYDGAVFLATNRDATYPTERGLFPGAGSIVAALAASAGREPAAVMGKPEPRALELIAREVGCSLEELLVVGDRLETDILCARRAGAWSALVLSGVTDRKRLRSVTDPDELPHFVLRDVGQLPDLFAHPARYRWATPGP